jgi:hypothetical protein
MRLIGNLFWRRTDVLGATMGGGTRGGWMLRNPWRWLRPRSTRTGLAGGAVTVGGSVQVSGHQ